MSNEPVVLLHGFYHGAWAWTEVIAELAGRGRTAVAVDMAAHGLHATSPASAGRRPFDSAAYATEPSPVSGVGLDAATDLLVEQLEIIGKGKPVCVVAHSMGGAVLTRAAERQPGLVAHMVYMAAYMPASNTPCLDYPSLPEGRDNRFMQLLVGDPAAIGALRIDHRSPDRETQATIREALLRRPRTVARGGRDRPAQLRRAAGNGGGEHHLDRTGLGIDSPYIRGVYGGPHHSGWAAAALHRPGGHGVPREPHDGRRAAHGTFGVSVGAGPRRGHYRGPRG
jgi:pimeloyl-ACP methyl ester carboxylesterase